MNRPSKDDVERLSRGQPTRTKIGSRRISHRLTQKERILFVAAQRQGFLKVPVTGVRVNVLNVYRLWCEAEGREFIVRGGPNPFTHMYLARTKAQSCPSKKSSSKQI